MCVAKARNLERRGCFGRAPHPAAPAPFSSVPGFLLLLAESALLITILCLLSLLQSIFYSKVLNEGDTVELLSHGPFTLVAACTGVEDDAEIKVSLGCLNYSASLCAHATKERENAKVTPQEDYMRKLTAGFAHVYSLARAQSASVSRSAKGRRGCWWCRM